MYILKILYIFYHSIQLDTNNLDAQGQLNSKKQFYVSLKQSNMNSNYNSKCYISSNFQVKQCTRKSVLIGQKVRKFNETFWKIFKQCGARVYSCFLFSHTKMSLFFLIYLNNVSSLKVVIWNLFRIRVINVLLLDDPFFEKDTYYSLLSHFMQHYFVCLRLTKVP